MSTWKHVTTAPHLHRVMALWFQGSSGVLCGDYRSLDQLMTGDPYESNATKEAIILRSTNLMQWEKVYSGRGEVHAVMRANETRFYALGTRFSLDGTETPFLLWSDSRGDSWDEIDTTPPSGSVGIAFYSAMGGYAWSQDTAYRTLDGGTSWRETGAEISAASTRNRPFLDNSGNLWGFGDGFLVCISPSGDVFEEALPPDFDAYFVAGRGADIWVLGRAGGAKGTIRIVRRAREKGFFEPVVELPRCVPDLFHVGERAVVVVGSDVTKMPPRALVFLSDQGVDNLELQSTQNFTVGPAFVEEDTALWAYGGADQIFRYPIQNAGAR